jgi:hypothetical protein
MRVIKGRMRGTRRQETRASTKCQVCDPSTPFPATAGTSNLGVLLEEFRGGIEERSASRAVGGQHAR